MPRQGWVRYAVAMTFFSGFWGAFSGLPTMRYGYPAELVYAIWAVVMVVPAVVVLRHGGLDRRPVAAGYGFAIGLTGAGGQLLLLQALALGPAYLIFPVVALSPAVTVLLAVVLLGERMRPLATVGVVMTLVAAVLFGSSPGWRPGVTGAWLPLVAVVVLSWGVQALLMRKAAMAGIGESTSFTYMTLSGLLLVPLALSRSGGPRLDLPWQAPVLAGGTQLLNALAALFLVMAISRGKVSLVVPVTSALPPVVTTVLSLMAYHRLPTALSAFGIVLALLGSALTTSDSQSADREHAASTPG
jgi:drug/metabolite transporter (DMT)-like permease